MVDVIPNSMKNKKNVRSVIGRIRLWTNKFPTVYVADKRDFRIRLQHCELHVPQLYMHAPYT